MEQLGKFSNSLEFVNVPRTYVEGVVTNGRWSLCLYTSILCSVGGQIHSALVMTYIGSVSELSVFVIFGNRVGWWEI